MRKKTGSLGFWAATVILVSVAALSVAGTAMCRTNLSSGELEGYYREKEDRMIKDTRAYLNRSGFENSGVMLTRVVDGDGSRMYTLTVHHREIDRLEESEKEALARELSTFAFEEAGCSFYYKFLFSD